MEQSKRSIQSFEFLVILPNKNLSGSVIGIGIETDIGEKIEKKKICERLAAELKKMVLLLGPQKVEAEIEKIRQQMMTVLWQNLKVNFYDVFLGLRSWENVVELNGLSKDLDVIPILINQDHSKTLFSFLFNAEGKERSSLKI